MPSFAQAVIEQKSDTRKIMPYGAECCSWASLFPYERSCFD